jgi:hypothetical protein
MAIQKKVANSNPVVADELAKRPYPTGDKVGDFVAPDFPIDAELVDKVTVVEHKLNLDDLRASGAEAKKIDFEEPGAKESISVVERAQKSTVDSRDLEDAGKAGIQIATDRAELHRNDILDAKEYRIAQITTSTGSFGANHKDTSGVNFGSIDLIKTLDGAQEYIATEGRYGRARKAVIGRKALRAARVNQKFADFCKSTPAARGSAESGGLQRTLAALAEFLELDEIRLADFNRVLGDDTTPTDFWPSDFFLLFNDQPTVSTRTFAKTVVVPYGNYQDVAEGTLVDVRMKKLDKVEELTEIGAFHRYRTYLLNANLAFIWTGIVGY